MLSWAWIALSILATNFTLERGVTGVQTCALPIFGMNTEDMKMVATAIGRMKSSGKTTLEYINILDVYKRQAWEHDTTELRGIVRMCARTVDADAAVKREIFTPASA